MWFIQLMRMGRSNFQVIGSGKIAIPKNGRYFRLSELSYEVQLKVELRIPTNFRYCPKKGSFYKPIKNGLNSQS